VSVEGAAPESVETGLTALLFAAVFLAGGSIHLLRALGVERRAVISFSAGTAVAYAFVHVMPELHGVRLAFVRAVSIALRFDGKAIYFVALVGFMTFYGLDHLRSRLRKSAAEERVLAAYRLHVAGFAAYVGLIGYLLVRNLEETPTSTALYAVAIGFHFLAVDHALAEENGARYKQSGRGVLAAMALLGWALGQLVAIPQHVVALLLAFLSGAIIVNSTIMELPSEKDGRFIAFLIGGLLYGSVLLALG